MDYYYHNLQNDGSILVGESSQKLIISALQQSITEGLRTVCACMWYSMLHGKNVSRYKMNLLRLEVQPRPGSHFWSHYSQGRYRTVSD